MATKKVLHESDQRRFKENPYNRKHGYAQGKIHVREETCAVLLGSNTLIGAGCFVRVDECCLVGLDVSANGTLELSTAIFDHSDNLITLIERNEWVTGEPTPWDLESDYQYLKLRSKPHDVLLEIQAKHPPVRLRAKLRRRGIEIDCSPSKILVNGGSLKGMVMTGCRLAGHCLAVSSHSGAGGIVPMNLLPADPLFGQSPVR
jgi:hypothetical protein